MDTSNQDRFEKVSVEEIPKDKLGKTRVDLYVHLPFANRYVRYIAAGDAVDQHRIEALKTHPVPDLFRRSGDAMLPDDRPPPPEPTKDEFNKEVLGQALQADLKDMFIYISGDKADPSVAIKRFEGMSEKLMETVAPDIKTLNEHLKKQTQYLSLMSDAAAISTISVICAYANGFDSRKSYRELSYATLVMDIALAEFGDEQIKTYYSNRETLPPEVLKEILFHPMRSYQLAEQKLKSLSDTTMQLILTHHELYNGKGFPRGVRTEALFPIARVLSLAVDAFENLKKAELTGRKLGLIEIFEGLRDEAVEPHLRRHNKKLVDSVIHFLQTDNAIAPDRPTV